MPVRQLPADAAMDEAVATLERGGLVAIPTETVYGLAADATNGAAVARIYEAKGRPSFNPLIAHAGDLTMARELAEFNPLALRLAERFWPGPLTMVLPRRAGSPVNALVTAGLDTVAVRMPAGFGGALARRFGRPLAAPSANTSGRVSPTSAAHVAADLGGKVDLIVDGGRTPVGVESTIVRVEPGRLVLLRAGGVTADELAEAAGMEVERAAGDKIEAPGMMVSHYAPKAAVRLEAAEVRPGEALLAFGPHRAANADSAAAIRNLSPAGDLREAASNLFDFLQQLDAAGAAAIAVEPVPDHGLGEAINDRLGRAAADRR